MSTLEQLEQKIKWDGQGLVAAIVQDASTLEVLTLAYMNRESLGKTLKTGETWFWSRSRQELWHKGATSGNTQQVVQLKYDCDGDAVLVLVNRKGPACHTGAESCFFEVAVDRTAEFQNSSNGSSDNTDSTESSGSLNSATTATAAMAPAADENAAFSGAPAGELARFAVLNELERVIAQRDIERPEGTYTTYLFEKGLDKILKKVGEETAESIIAAKNWDNDELRMEVSDLIYHLLVLLRERRLPLDDVLGELALRHERPRRD
ncbi:bifunctional phosphoribosyl-AMP cyclohydrolase/phosphoribosyl-ATP pyrophosphatase [Paenibacillus yonginensis]|uniref:Histidine biosynthesis bifunctional protein HisIE n=1 Tax=Paenibacillus yonginensis TaxID=1462996 RepID=A0A1B1N4F1_9BACL|nr:phosphoribosyl-AMP cyclohydrolase [Paenibacillus yonginensis]ANS76286.1 bifunctional phosphoribosyl-AMP cyclohydrolase/phosphoribosyl-ATP pyrophosphatase [Paenibacillus yonginensis]